DARVHGQPGHQREVRADAARRAAAQVLLLERAVHGVGRRRLGPLHPSQAGEDGGRREPREAAHRPADRAPVRGTGRADRPPHRGQVPRPARHPPGPHAEARMSAPLVSVLVPAKDEAENLPEFVRQCASALPALGVPFEVVVVDDGSRDETAAVLASLEAEHSFLRHVTHRRQRGIADALHSAGSEARGGIFVFYPADLQYRPEDIPALVAPILAGTADIVTGTKQGKYEKAFVSTVYNTLCRWLFGVRVTDLNSVKAYRREVMATVPLRPDWHRFMVAIAAADGHRLTSVPVPLYPRTAGVSKFTWTRIPVGVLDLVSVWFQLRFGRKPMLFFGLAGAV